jgi:hypothetical protein
MWLGLFIKKNVAVELSCDPALSLQNEGNPIEELSKKFSSLQQSI